MVGVVGVVGAPPLVFRRCWVLSGFVLVLSGFVGFAWVLSGFGGFYRVLLGFGGLWLALVGVGGFWWVLVGFSAPILVDVGLKGEGGGPGGGASLAITRRCACWGWGARQKTIILRTIQADFGHTWVIQGQLEHGGHDGGIGKKRYLNLKPSGAPRKWKFQRKAGSFAAENESVKA